MRHVDGPPARRPGRLGACGFGTGFPGGRGGLGFGGPGFGGLGFGGLGFGGLGFGGLGFGGLRLGRLGFRRLGLGTLGCGFRSGLSLPVARGFVLVRLLQRDLLLDGLLFARRFRISPFLAGRPAIGGPPRGGPVQR
jgi:hypothetical protein